MSTHKILHMKVKVIETCHLKGRISDFEIDKNITFCIFFFAKIIELYTIYPSGVDLDYRKNINDIRIKLGPD